MMLPPRGGADAGPVQAKRDASAPAIAGDPWRVTGDDPFGVHLLGAPVQRAIAVGLAAAEDPARLPADGGGAALPPAVQAKMEASFGADFSAVRIHEGPRSAAIGARAYAQGTDIHFAPGEYQPDSERGQALLGHELAHVVQQAQGRVAATTQAKGVGVNDDAALEREADEMGERAARGEPARPGGGAIATGAGAAAAPVQRLIWLAMDGDSIITTKQDGERPPGCLPGGSQGDHTTPYTTLQDQVANAIEGVTLADAWVNLKDTFLVYQSLPGWAESKKFTTNDVGGYVAGLLAAKGDLNALQVAVNQMLVLRNQIALTSLPKGGHGNGEGKWAGSLQYQERQFQLGHAPALNKNQVIEYMWKAFDHGRVNALGDDKRTKILEQHARTMADAYPQLAASLGIDAKAIADYYPNRDWLNYDPG